ncbi:GtrA family protein [Plantibacter flavus]|uniref:GtrA family protein n=1 Tax=Plantibacter flavus TaxID=150123 RepID=UPI003F175BDE
MSIRDRFRERNGLLPELLRFAVVGGAGFLVDVGVFNILAFFVLEHSGSGGLIAAKAISTSLAILTNWIGSRLYTFSGRGRSVDVVREAVEFAGVSLAGGAIALLCLWVSHSVLHLTSPLADNVSANVVGLILGSVFRFVLYRFWVFAPRRAAVRGVTTAS